MNESSETAKRKVERVSDEQNEQVGEPLPGRVAALNHIGNQIESLSEHTSRQSEGVETDIAQHIAHKPRGHIIGVPKA